MHRRVAERLPPKLHPDTPLRTGIRICERTKKGFDQFVQRNGRIAGAEGIGDDLPLGCVAHVGNGFDDLFLAFKIEIDRARTQTRFGNDVPAWMCGGSLSWKYILRQPQ